MDFADNPEEAAFRAQVRAWLQANAAHAPQAREVAGMVNYDVDEARAWQRRLYDSGWAGITWPVEHGGRGLSAIHAAIFQEELSKVAPADHPFRPAIGDAGRLIMQLGTPAQQQAHLRPILRGEQIWCHLLSEPNAGSDLASLTTRAEQDGDSFVVNGQKVWTSYAHLGDFGLLLARTNTRAPKHLGLTYFIVDMASPGITIRPLKQITGDSHFNEVFFDDARLPAASVIGDVDKGWTVAHASMANEREFVGNRASTTRRFETLNALAATRHVNGDTVLRQQLAQLYIHEELLRYQWLRMQTSLSRDLPLRSEMSLMKLAISNQVVAAANVGMSCAGASAMLESARSVDFLAAPAYKIGGGTDNIQRNTIAERLLGLPKEPRTA